MEEDMLILTDEDGIERQFELLDVIEYQGEEYVVLYPADEGDEEQVHILRVLTEDLDEEESQYEGLDDPDLIETVYQLFRKRNGL